jgi:RNA polymerase sigma-70 factor (ECF subfamily)
MRTDMGDDRKVSGTGTRRERADGHASPGEKESIALARRGDREAFGNLYRSHVGRVYGLCFRLSGRRETAEELTQEVFIRVWKKLSSFRFESAFSSWLYRLTVNVVLAELRSAARRRVMSVPGEEVSALPEATRPGPPGAAIDLESAIASLPLGARTVFVLHDIEGYRHDEIARLTGLARGTSKAQLHRARKLLRERLER